MYLISLERGCPALRILYIMNRHILTCESSILSLFNCCDCIYGSCPIVLNKLSFIYYVYRTMFQILALREIVDCM